MAKDKKSEKKSGSKKGTITCERTYVSDRCSRNGIQQDGRRSSSSPPNSPIALRVLDVPCRHQRRGAVREKRPVSLDKPRPAHQRVDNAYVETPFVDGAASIQMQQNRKQQKKQKKHRQQVAAVFSNIIAKNTEFIPSPVRYNDCQPSCSFDLPAMNWSDEPPPRPGEGIIDEFPPYVPWKAELSEQLDTCQVCYKCRCSTCQMRCKHPGLRVFGKLDVQALCDKEFVESTIAYLPYLEKTPRCKSADAARARAAKIAKEASAKTKSAAAAPAKTAPAKTATAETAFARTAPVAKTAPAKIAITKTETAETASTAVAPAKTESAGSAPVKTAPAKTATAETAFARTAPVAKTAPAKIAITKTETAETAIKETASTKTASAAAAPAKTESAGSAPVKTAPAKTATAETAFARTAPVAKTAPAKIAITKTETAETAIKETASTKTASAAAAPAKTAPVKTATVETAPAKTASTAVAPAKTESAGSAPVKTAPAKTATAETAFARTAPVAKTAPAKIAITKTETAETAIKETASTKTASTAVAPPKTAPFDAAAAAIQGNGAYHDQDADSASSVKCRLRWLLCCLCSPCPPCRMVDEPLVCAAGCRGNRKVQGCKCVNWGGVKQNSRGNMNATAAALYGSRDRRRCHQYYITALPNPNQKKSMFRRLLCL